MTRALLSDLAYSVISRVFESGTQEEKEECIKSFYQRVNYEDEIYIRSIGYDGVLLEKDGDLYSIKPDSGKYKCNGRPIRDADLCDWLGVPIAFLEGMSMAIEFAGARLETLEQQKQLAKRCEFESKRLAATRKSLAKKSAAECDINGACEHYKMPDVPQPQYTRGEICAMAPFSGIYFEWDGLLCVYVGKSINVPFRVGKGHHKLEDGLAMSFIPMDKSLIGRHELFYIWLLNPSKNGGL